MIKGTHNLVQKLATRNSLVHSQVHRGPLLIFLHPLAHLKGTCQLQNKHNTTQHRKMSVVGTTPNLLSNQAQEYVCFALSQPEGIRALKPNPNNIV